MAIEKAKEFLLALKEKGADEAWAAKAAEAKTEEEKFALAADMAKEMGYDLTAEDVREALAGIKKDGGGLEALDDDAVEGVAGGGAPVDFRHLKCPNCKKEVIACYTGQSRSSYIFFTEYLYECQECREKFWY